MQSSPGTWPWLSHHFLDDAKSLYQFHVSPEKRRLVTNMPTLRKRRGTWVAARGIGNRMHQSPAARSILQPGRQPEWEHALRGHRGGISSDATFPRRKVLAGNLGTCPATNSTTSSLSEMNVARGRSRVGAGQRWTVLCVDCPCRLAQASAAIAGSSTQSRPKKAIYTESLLATAESPADSHSTANTFCTPSLLLLDVPLPAKMDVSSLPKLEEDKARTARRVKLKASNLSLDTPGL